MKQNPDGPTERRVDIPRPKEHRDSGQVSVGNIIADVVDVVDGVEWQLPFQMLPATATPCFTSRTHESREWLHRYHHHQHFLCFSACMAVFAYSFLFLFLACFLVLPAAGPHSAPHPPRRRPPPPPPRLLDSLTPSTSSAFSVVSSCFSSSLVDHGAVHTYSVPFGTSETHAAQAHGRARAQDHAEAQRGVLLTLIHTSSCPGRKAPKENILLVKMGWTLSGC